MSEVLKKRMRVGIDIDEVVVKFVEHYMDFIKERGINPVGFSEVFSYDISKVLGIERKMFFDFLDEYNESDLLGKEDFIDGAKEGVEFLRDNFDVYFITARGEKAWKGTQDFIFEKFGILGDRIIFSKKVVGDGERKDKICEEFGISLIIEDSVSSLVYAENGISVLLLDKPWNREVSHDRIIRCRDWSEILEGVKNFENDVFSDPLFRVEKDDKKLGVENE